MAENNRNNTSGGNIPKSTGGLNGSVSPEDLKKYNLIPSDGNEEVDQQAQVNNGFGPSAPVTPSAPQSDENDHLHRSQRQEEQDHLRESEGFDQRNDNVPDQTANNDFYEPKNTTVPPVSVPPVSEDTNGNNAEDTYQQPEQDFGAVDNPEKDMSKESVNNEQEQFAQRTDSQDNDTRENRESKTREDTDKPWEKSFDNDTDESGHVSRTVKQSKQRGNHTLVTTLVIALIVIMFAPVVINAIHGSSNSDLDSTQSSKSVENKDKNSADSKKKKKTTTKKKSSAKKKSDTSKKKSSSSNSNDENSNSNSGTVSQNNSTQEASNQTANSTNDSTTDSQNSTTSQQSQGTTSNTNSNSNNSTDSTTSDSSNSDSSSATSYYTVKAGDNWFRIALNNNLTTAQLKNLNGGVSSLTPGTQLRVK